MLQCTVIYNTTHCISNVRQRITYISFLFSQLQPTSASLGSAISGGPKLEGAQGPEDLGSAISGGPKVEGAQGPEDLGSASSGVLSLRVEYILMYSCGAATRIRITYSAWFTLYMYRLRVAVFIEQAKSESNTVFDSSFRVFNM